MKQLLLLLVSALLTTAAVAQPYYLASELQDWKPDTTPMYDDGTNGDLVAGDGIYSRELTAATPKRYGWKVTRGTWDPPTYPAADAWFITTTENQTVLFTFDTNTKDDQWLPQSNIVMTNEVKPTSLVAVGDWQKAAGETEDWKNNSTVTAMNDNGTNGDAVAGDGIFTYHTNALPAGSWNGKGVMAGSWDGWGTDGRSQDAKNVSFTTTSANQDVYIQVNVNTGRIAITLDKVVPVELTSFAASVSGGNVVLRWSTATEVNNLGFEVERSLKGTWEKIGFVEGSGSSTSAKSYSFTDQKPAAGVIKYRLKQIDMDGSYAYIAETEVNAAVPDKFELQQNYPNPFNPSTVISYNLPAAGFVTLKVYDILGNEAATLVNDYKDAGAYEVNFNAAGLSTGMYVYQISSGNVTLTKSMMLIK